MHFHPAIAPVKVGILPLSKKLNEGAEKIYHELSKIYKRLLEVELTLKQKIIIALEKTYAEKAIYRLIPNIKSLDHNI